MIIILTELHLKVIENANEIIPILLDFALVSDYTLFIYIKNNKYETSVIERGDIPDITFSKEDFTFFKQYRWPESNSVYINGENVAEFHIQIEVLSIY